MRASCWGIHWLSLIWQSISEAHERLAMCQNSHEWNQNMSSYTRARTASYRKLVRFLQSLSLHESTFLIKLLINVFAFLLQPARNAYKFTFCVTCCCVITRTKYLETVIVYCKACLTAFSWGCMIPRVLTFYVLRLKLLRSFYIVVMLYNRLSTLIIWINHLL